MTRYEQGFLTKCAEYGIEPRVAAALLKRAGSASHEVHQEVMNPERPEPWAVNKGDTGGGRGHFAPYNPNDVTMPGVDPAVPDNMTASDGYKPQLKWDVARGNGRPGTPQDDFNNLTDNAKNKITKLQSMRPGATIAFPSSGNSTGDNLWNYLSPDGTVSSVMPANANGSVIRMKMPSRIKTTNEWYDDQATMEEERYLVGNANRSDPRMMAMAGRDTNATGDWF